MSQLEHALGLIAEVPDFPQPGVLFRDLSPLFADAKAFRVVVDALAETIPADTDVLAAVEARGFLLGGGIAAAHDFGLVPVRKPGKLPTVADEVSYDLEYGSATLQLPAGTIRAGQRVAVIDDVLATGGTAAATCELVERAGAEVTVVSVVVDLAALGGRERLAGRSVRTLLSV
ncbi:adenine phosphoribosyltransferase [Labedaea rhizosphaerae]|uniref:Adenine phosphoribosyltransferase n=1 Tax=Labedaea rhizosphaerae TaxID=598644 RepID=A0A4R6SHL7_LABRH|nr:adenine phosphoribosyltransferase [Labedaea rhizosphaerae]TDQ01305.1 adenine phosphoribosyltransferase [Labedaea rhizosphaerae]